MKLKRNEIAAIKNVARIVNPKLKEKDRKLREIAKLQDEINVINDEIKVWEQGIKNMTGFGIEELVEREVVNGKTNFKVREDVLEEETDAVEKEVVGEEVINPIVEPETNNIF